MIFKIPLYIAYVGDIAANRTIKNHFQLFWPGCGDFGFGNLRSCKGNFDVRNFFPFISYKGFQPGSNGFLFDLTAWALSFHNDKFRSFYFALSIVFLHTIGRISM